MSDELQFVVLPEGLVVDCRQTEVRRTVAAGEGVEPSFSAFKAQRVASYTIPQEADTKMGRRGDREKKQRLRVTASPFLRVRSFGALGFEPRTLRLSGANTAYKAAALPLSYAPAYESKVADPTSTVCCPNLSLSITSIPRAKRR